MELYFFFALKQGGLRDGLSDREAALKKLHISI